MCLSRVTTPDLSPSTLTIHVYMAGLAQILEFRAEVVAQLAGGAADVVAGLPQCARRPADGAGQSLGPQDHQTGDHQDQHLAPADVGEHYVAGVSAPGVTVSMTWRPS